MSSYLKSKHDLGFLRTDGSTTVGLRLARDKDGNPIYRTFDDEYLAQQLFTGTPGYGNLPPEKELAIRQDDWRSGFGQETYDANDPKRYFSSIGMDMRYKGMAVAGPIATGIALPATHTLPTYVVLNPSFTTATGDDFDDWTEEAEATCSVTKETTTTKDAPNSVKLLTSTTGNYARVKQSFSNPTEWIGYTLTLTAWIYLRGTGAGGNAPGDVELQLWRNGADVASDVSATQGGWEQATLTYTVPAATTSLEIRLQAIGSDDTDNYDFVDLVELSYTAPVAKTHPSAFAEFNDRLYLDFGKFLYRLNTNGDGWTVAGTQDDVYGEFAAIITDLEPFTDNYLYIAIGLSNEYWYINTSETFVESDKTENMQFFQRVDAAAPTMWGNYSAYQIKSSTNPLNAGSWTADTTVDSSYHSITEMLSKSGALYIMKEDMPYYLSSAGAVQNDLAPELKSDTASTSGKNAFLWKGKLYIPFGAQGLLETDGTTNTFLNPASYCTNLSDFVGRVMTVTGDGEYLFVAVDNGTENEILAGREETIDGTTGWVWHPICEITLTPASGGVETMFVSSVYQKRLWIASTSSSDDVYYIKLPTGYGDITNDANRSFQNGAYFITPWLHGNFKSDSKGFIKLTLTMSDTTSTVYFTAEYQLKGSANWTEINSTAKFKTSPTTTGYIPVDDVSGVNPVSNMIRFKITAVTGAATSTPVLLDYDCRAILYPTNRRIIECEVLCDDVITLKDGTVEKGQAATIKAALEEARNATWPVTFYKIDESTIYVKFLPLQTAVTKKEKGRGTERHYLLRLQEIALS